MISPLRLPKIKDKQFNKEDTIVSSKSKDLSQIFTNPDRVGKLQKILKNITNSKNQNSIKNGLISGPHNNQQKVKSYLDANLDDTESDIFNNKNKLGISADNANHLKSNTKNDHIYNSVHTPNLTQNEDSQKQFSLKIKKLDGPRASRPHNGSKFLTEPETPFDKKKSIGRSNQTPTELIQSIFHIQNDIDNPIILKPHPPATNNPGVLSQKSISQINQFTATPKNAYNSKTKEKIEAGNSIKRSHISHSVTPNKPASKISLTKFTNTKTESAGIGQIKSEESKPKVNLETLVNIYEKLYGITQSENNLTNLMKYCDEYFELSENQGIPDLDKLFPDAKTNRSYKSYFIIERLSIFLIYQLCNDDFKLQAYNYYLTNIAKFTLCNFLNYSDTIINRASPAFQNNTKQYAQILLTNSIKKKWLEKLRQCIHGPDVQAAERNFSIPQLNEMLTRLLKLWIKITNIKKESLLFIESILDKIETIQFEKAMSQLQEHFKQIFNEKAKENENLNKSMPIQGNILDKVEIIQENVVTEPCMSTTTTENLSLKPSKYSYENLPSRNYTYHLPPLQQEDTKPIYSLVLDLDETLIHYEEYGGKGRFFVRPYAEIFLKEMSELYEITIFTAAVQDYADTVLNILDKNGYIKHRLYRHHTIHKPINNSFIKDLSKLGRDLKKTIIIDNSPENFRLQSDNGIEIKTWFNDPHDTGLYDLMPFLKELVINQVDDVRKSIRRFKEVLKNKRK